MFRYNLLPWLSLQAGPQLSILLNATDGSADIGSQFTTMDVGGAVGVGVGVDLPLKFIFSFRYGAGFTNVSTVDFSSLGLPDPSVTNKVIQFSLGYTLSRR